MRKYFKKNSYALFIGFLLVLLVASMVWAGTNLNDPTNPFYSDKTYQGYALLRVVFPDGKDEYYVYPIWGADPEDGVGSLYYRRPDGSQYISDKLDAFLRANDVEYDSGSGQFNIWPVYAYRNFPFILTSGMEGDGSFAMKPPYPDGALYLSPQEIKDYWNRHVWLVNPHETIPETGLGKAPGWTTTFTFIPPDLQAASVTSGAPAGGAIAGNTYYASAQFYMNYKMPGYSTVRLYQFKNNNTAVLLKEQPAFFGRFGGVSMSSVPWTMTADTTSIVAAVAMKYDNNTRSWVRDWYENSCVKLSGNNADANWGNNIKVASVAAGEIPKPPGENDKPSNLAVTDLALLNSAGQPVAGTVEVNKPYKVKATFKSSFDFGGYAKVRFYVKREAGWMELKKEENVYFQPKGTIEKNWDWTGTSEQVTLIATVAYRWWDQQKQYVQEPFEGRTETTYDDNKMESGVAGTDIPDGPPIPGSWEYPLYYHPLKTELVPIYEEHWEPVYGWKEVPFTKEEPNGKLRVYLVQ